MWLVACMCEMVDQRILVSEKDRSGGYTTFFVLNSTELETLITENSEIFVTLRICDVT